MTHNINPLGRPETEFGVDGSDVGSVAMMLPTFGGLRQRRDQQVPPNPRASQALKNEDDSIFLRRFAFGREKDLTKLQSVCGCVFE